MVYRFSVVQTTAENTLVIVLNVINCYNREMREGK